MSRANKNKEREYQREYYLANKAKVQAQIRRYRLHVAEKLAAYKESIPCMDCGNKYPACVMDFDHRDPETKSDNVGSITSWPAMRREIEKCDLVCANCHRIRTHL